MARSPDIEDDVRTLASMGYAQELDRRMGGFSNYCISLSIICILAGGMLTAVENGGAGRSKMVALGGVDLS